MTNLLVETEDVLFENDKKPQDVKWIGTVNGKTTWDVFAKLADKEYDSGYGGQEVNETLLVVGDTWWLERHEYDGSEWWEFKQMPIEPEYKEFKQEGDRYGDDEDNKSNYIFYN